MISAKVVIFEQSEMIYIENNDKYIFKQIVSMSRETGHVTLDVETVKLSVQQTS